MLKIKRTNISLTRGDSAYITLTIKDGSGEIYDLNDGDKVSVQVRDAVNTGALLFDGNISISDDGEIIWYIKPSDTKNLEVGTYYYDAQLEMSNGDIFTFISASTFKLLDEVTFTTKE